MEKKKRKKKVQQTPDAAETLDNEELERIVHEVLNKMRSGELPRIPVTVEIKAKGGELYDEYLRSIELQKDHIGKLEQEYADLQQDKTLSPEEKLCKNLALKIALMDIYHPHYLEFHEFIDDGYIDIKNELDLKNLEWPKDDGKWIDKFLKDGIPPKHEGYSIILDTESRMDGILYTSHSNIWISEQYFIDIFGKDYKRFDLASDKRAHLLAPDYNHTSVHDIYEWWIPALALDKIKSKDLLDQILVCYTIKKALNGHKEAIEKLTEVLSNGLFPIDKRPGPRSKQVHRYTIDLLSHRLHKELDKRFSEEDKRQIPTTINLDKGEVVWRACALIPVLIRGIHPSEVIEKLLCTDEKADLLPFPKWIKKFYFDYFKKYERLEPNPYGPINAEFRWNEDLKFRMHSFNSYTFVPGRGYKIGPKSNIYTWLFHKKHGKIYQLLRDHYWPSIRDNHPFLFHFIRKKKQPEEKKLSLDREILRSLVSLFIKNGIPREDAEIFCRVAAGEKKAKVAKEFKKSRPTIYAKYNRVRSSKTLKNPEVLRLLRSILTE